MMPASSFCSSVSVRCSNSGTASSSSPSHQRSLVRRRWWRHKNAPPPPRAARRGGGGHFPSPSSSSSSPSSESSPFRCGGSLSSSVSRLPSGKGSPKLILGSSSSSRREILRASGAKFYVMQPGIDEEAVGVDLREGCNPEDLVSLLAEAKADALVERLRKFRLDLERDDVILLTGDAVVTYRGEIREKPGDIDEARAFIKSYAKAPCETVSAVCLHQLRTGRREIGVNVSCIHFYDIPEDVVDLLVADAGVLDCSGGLMVEHPAIAPYIKNVTGSLDSLMGMDTAIISELLGRFNTEEEEEEEGRTDEWTDRAPAFA